MKKAVIICNGGIDDYTLVSRQAVSFIKDCYVIAVDGGVRHARAMNLSIDHAFGDFDSISDKDMVYIKKHVKNIATFSKDKDYSDTELAVDYCIKNKFEQVIVLAYRGSRLDHSLANILMFAAKSKYINLIIIDEKNIGYFTHTSITLNASLNDFISILPLSENVRIKESHGLNYPLTNSTLTLGSSLSISNFAVDTTQKIMLEDGNILITISKD